MTLPTTAYRRMSSQPRTIFKISRVFLLSAIVGLIVSCIMKVDIVARAAGLVVPANETRPVSATIEGIISEFVVSEGERVSQGDVLVRLEDPSLSIELARVQETILRLAMEKATVDALLNATAEEDVLASLRALNDDNEAVESWMQFLRKQREERDDALEEFAAKEELIQAELTALATNSAALEGILALQMDKDLRVRDLVERGIQDQFTGLDVMITTAEISERVSRNSSEITVKNAELRQIAASRSRYQSQLRTKNIERLIRLEEEASNQVAAELDLRERMGQLMVRAPIGGTVQEISTAALHQRVGTKPLLSIVPHDNELLVIAGIKNQDIGQIAPGQSAELLFDAYPLAIYGTTQAFVETVTEDIAGISSTIPVPVNVTDVRAYAGEALEASTGLTYLAKLGLDEDSNPRIQLRPGLSVLVNIKTGEQRVIMFFVNPLLRAWHWTLKE
ncbi:HlyD family efflux transporter periplasmic adaptor subunit [Shimia ponticola]|uniref:HlyD family efflux transporter periplasmic adaptor subunit n=1 Tax=Shimia ponticola TaxID=2582893 RepID=UPI0011BE129E|nr:HlyD family efflux transporter periplasmic adaptor subunit [Shimia ponticola]